MRQKGDPQKYDVQKRDSSLTGSPSSKWEALYRRLEAAQRMVEQRHAPTPAQEKATLKARAKATAQDPLPEQSHVPELEIVTFRLAHETYGFESRYIREVYPLKDLCPLPCVPTYILGLVNVRGSLLSILDLKKFFGLPATELDSHHQAIILHNETMEFGVLADTLLNVRYIARQSLQPSLPTLVGIGSEFLLGITPEQVIILDAEKLLSNRAIIVYEEVEI